MPLELSYDKQWFISAGFWKSFEYPVPYFSANIRPIASQFGNVDCCLVVFWLIKKLAEGPHFHCTVLDGGPKSHKKTNGLDLKVFAHHSTRYFLHLWFGKSQYSHFLLTVFSHFITPETSVFSVWTVDIPCALNHIKWFLLSFSWFKDLLQV